MGQEIHSAYQVPINPSSSTTEYRQPPELLQELIRVLSMPPRSTTSSYFAPSQPLLSVEHEQLGPSHFIPTSFPEQQYSTETAIMQPTLQTTYPPDFGFSTIQFLDPLARFEQRSSRPLPAIPSSSSSTAVPNTAPLEVRTKGKGNNPVGVKGVIKCQRCQNVNSACHENPEDPQGPCLRCLRARSRPLECVRKPASERERKGRKRARLEH